MPILVKGDYVRVRTKAKALYGRLLAARESMTWVTIASVSRLQLWNSAMRIYQGTTSCVVVEVNPGFAVSAATLTYESRCRSCVWLVLLVTGSGLKYK